MHIGYICNEYPPTPHGGVGSFVQTLARSLVARGHRVSVIGVYPNLTEDAWTTDQGVSVLRLAASLRYMIGPITNAKRIRKAFEHPDNGLDLIEGSEMSFGVDPMRFCPTRVIRMHGGHHFFSAELGHNRKPLRARVERRSFAAATHLCAVSQYVANSTLRQIGEPTREATIIPNPVDASKFAPAPANQVVGNSLLFTGTLCEKKGVRQLVLAMPAILAKCEQAHLSIVGRDTVDESGRSFQSLLESLIPKKFSDRITFIGPVAHDQLPRLISQADVCVFPSHMEACPLAWLEAMSAGRPVVASRTGPGPELIADGETGLLCDPHDPTSIAAAVLKVLQNPDWATQLGAAARDRVKQDFAVEVLVKRNEDFYKRCIEK